MVLTLVSALALASFHPWDLAVGAGLSAALLFASRRFVFGSDGTAPQPAANSPCSGGCGLRAVCRGRLPGGTGGQLGGHAGDAAPAASSEAGHRGRTHRGEDADGGGGLGGGHGAPRGSFFVDVDRE